MFDEYRWRGESIADVHEWARSRGERMVKYRAERTIPSMLTGQLEREVREGEMPQSFWDSLLVSNGWFYEEIG